MNKQPLLICEHLSKVYQEGALSTQVLKDVCFSINESEMMAIVGSSGSGKSTLLHLLGGLDTPSEGEVIFRGNILTASHRISVPPSVTKIWGLFISFTTYYLISRH